VQDRCVSPDTLRLELEPSHSNWNGDGSPRAHVHRW
jgi:hypothetical protein